MNVKDITDDRESIYGPPYEHFSRTVGCLNALGFRRHGRELSPLDWPVCMVADKLARLANTPDHEDSWHDVQGYGWTAEAVMDQGSSSQPADSRSNGPYSYTLTSICFACQRPRAPNPVPCQYCKSRVVEFLDGDRAPTVNDVFWPEAIGDVK
jgi:hypothetical protein